MEENFKQAKVLLDKYHEGLTTHDDNVKVEQAFNRFADAAKDDDTAVDAQLIGERIWAKLPASVSGAGISPVPLWPRIAVAAAALVSIVFGIWFFSGLRHSEFISGSADYAKNDIGPGKQGATLTLASGKKIRLTDAVNGQLAEEAGVEISKSADGQLVYEIKGSAEANKINTLSTAKGETYIVTLPDKSKVWLNAASSLTYTAGLTEGGKRKVKLTGEAYFEIAKDKTHPFVVESKGQQVEVLGTHFNVNAYGDEPTVATTLLEGSVNVTEGENRRIIKPGQEAVNNGKSIQVNKANIENIVDWKNGDFNLDGLEFTAAMRKIARWYDVEVIYEISTPSGIETGGWISRNNKLKDVLKLIEKSGFVHFKVDGRKIYVSK